MKTLRSRLILSHLLPVIIIIPLVVAALVYIVQTQVLISSIRSELITQATLLAQLAYNDPLILVDPFMARSFIDRMSPYLSSRVMILTPDGLILAAPEGSDQSSLETLITVDEFRQVRNGKIIVHTERQQGSLEEFADIFVPVISPEGQLIGIVRSTYGLSGFDERFTQVRWLVVWVLIGGLGLGLLIGWLLGWQIGKPILGVAHAVDQLARGEQLHLLEERGPVEIRQLESAFNNLVERLRSLESARKQLLANLVHEIGRPLGALRSAIQALRNGAIDQPSLRSELLEGMDETSGRLQRLLDDLSHLHDQVLGPLELNKQRISLSSWLQKILVPYRQVAYEKSINWQTEIPDDLPEIFFDPDRLAQALGNLVVNAIQFTPDQGSVTISAYKKESVVEIKVIDTGIGISPEEQEKIWKPFYRGSNRGRFPQGMGLGLSIARDVILAHKGTISLESEVGKGSKFTITLPLDQIP